MYDSDFLFFKIQARTIELNLQLAETEEKPKRTGVFETTYKTESGKEIAVKRSPDGKFATKGDTPTPSFATNTVEAPPVDPQAARENGKAVRKILTGKIGDDLKKNLVVEFEHRPILKDAIEKTDFAEITRGDADALTNISRYMSEKFEQAIDASSMLTREILGAAVGVASFVARSLVYGAAFGATLIVGSAGIGVFKKGMRPDKALIQQTSAIAPAVLRALFSKEFLISRMQVGAIFEGVFRAIDLASEELGKKSPPLIEPEADKAVREAMRDISSNTLKNNLLASALQTPGIAEGIRITSVENIIKGDKDPFSNAASFLQTKIAEAATTISEKKREIAVGAGVVALTVAATALGTVTGTLTASVLLTTIRGLISGKGLTEAIKLGLMRLTPAGAKELFSNRIVGRISEYKIIKSAIDAIKKQVEAIKATSDGDRETKKFDDKKEGVKTPIAEELDREKILQVIASRKEEPPNPKRAEQIQKEIISIHAKIADGATKVKTLTAGKTSFTDTDKIELINIAKKETELRDALIEKRGKLAAAEGRGFSLQKRFNELVEIEKTEGKQSPSYKWRASVIKAEIKYGEKLDNLDKPEGYKELMDAMKKPAPAPGKYTSISSSDGAKFYNFFLGNMSIPQTALEEQEAVVKQAQEAGTVLQNYLSTPIVAQVGLEGGVTCAIPGGNNAYSQITKNIAKGSAFLEPIIQTETFNDKKVDGFINIGDAVVRIGDQNLQGYNASASRDEHIREMMWHESGHILEVKLGKVEESVAFREERSNEVPADRKEIPPKGISLGSQDFTLGDFYSPYIGLRMKGQGKYKDRDTATEVLSSGMELLSNPVLARRGAKADRETLLYALAAMNEKIKD